LVDDCESAPAACDGDVEKSFTKDELLTNVTLYWVTETIGSSFLPYADFVNAGALTWTIEAFRQWAGSTSFAPEMSKSAGC